MNRRKYYIAGLCALLCAFAACNDPSSPAAPEPAHVHSWGRLATVTEPTCTEAGVGTISCTLCGETPTESVIPPLGHEWGEWVASETNATVETHACKRDPTHIDTRTVGLAYTLVGNEGYSVSAGTARSGDVIIPKYHRADGESEYLPVIAIGENAFRDCVGLTSVTIPDSVTTIGGYAFYRCAFTSVTIPDSVTTIWEGTFAMCAMLTSVTIPDSVTSIGHVAFSDCLALTSVIIPNSVVSIGNSAFRGCAALTSVTIPDSVTSIGASAFSACEALANITVDPENSNYCDIDGVLCNKVKTAIIQFPAGRSGSYAIPDSVTAIGNYAFYYCTALTSITIPDSVTSIGGSAFYGCTALTSITIPDSVTTIENWAFEYCTSLTSVTIPDGVTAIGYGTFSVCTSLTSVTFDSGSNITTFGVYAFPPSNSDRLRTAYNAIPRPYATTVSFKWIGGNWVQQ